QNVVGPAEPERCAHHPREAGWPGMIGDVIEVELRVLPVVDGRRDRLVADRPDADGRLDRRGRAKAVSQCPLDRTDGQAVGVIAENGLDYPGLDLVVERSARAVSIVVV